MLLITFFVGLVQPILAVPPITPDSVEVHFSFVKMEPATSPQVNYFYQVDIENISNQTCYVILPKWIENKPLDHGLMLSFRNDSHDGLSEFSFSSDPSFEVFVIKPHSEIKDSFKLRTKSNLSKISKVELPFYLANDIKIGELHFVDYLAHQDFYGDHLMYEFLGSNNSLATVPLR